MIKRPFLLPLWAVLISLFVSFGCGKRLPTGIESGQGYPRTVMVELFTSEFCTNCPKADAAAERLASEMGNSLCLMEMHPITYQASGGNIDSLGLAATDTLATGYEAGFGTAAGLPYFSCDGLIDNAGVGATDTQSTYLKYQQMADIRKVRTSPLQINLTAQLDQGGIRYSAAINSDASLPPSLNLGLVLVVVEDSVAAYGKQNRYLARKVYPGTRGDSLALTASSSLTRLGIIPSDPGWLEYRLTLVAYVRNNSTKEILQSAKVRIVAATTPPAAPSLYLPANGATGTSLSPILSWNASGGAASYTLQYDDDSLFAGGESQSGLTGTSFKINKALVNATNYYWRVNASNNAGISAWSNVFNFTTTAAALPDTAILLFPAQNDTGVSKSPAFIWKAAAGAAKYGLQVATSNSFAQAAIFSSLSDLTDTSLVILGLAPGVTYFWRAKAGNEAGYSAWNKTPGSFTTTTNPAPEAPILASPANGELYSGTSPSLKWKTSFSATGYSLQVSPYGDFRYLRYDQSGATDTSFNAGGLDSLTTYYWRVNASNVFGTSVWSTRAFTDSRGYSFSRVLVPDTMSWVPDTLIAFSLQDTLIQPEIPGFNIYYSNLSGSGISIGTHAPRNSCSDTTLMEGGQLCNTRTCGAPGGSLTDNRWDVNNIQHWTVHMVFNAAYPPPGKYSFTLLSWSTNNPALVMSRKLYIEVLP